jgi:hypothetical protein
MEEKKENTPQVHEATIEGLIHLVLESDKSVKDQRILINELRKIHAPIEDRWIYRIIVSTLGFSGILTIVAVYFLYGADKTPEGLIALGSAAIGALAGMLVPGSGQNSDKNLKN